MQGMCVGVPGTGKSFFMVAFMKKYFTYDSFFRMYEIKKDVLILTNIAGLKFFGADCWNVESPELLGCAKEGIPGKVTREEFFTVPNMQKIMDEKGYKNIILVLDEIQNDQYFPAGYKNSDVLYLFQYHRHIGMHIILGTQDHTLISRGVLAQCEWLAHGKLRSKKIMGGMSYRFTDKNGNYLYDKTLKADQDVFRAYDSMTTEEIEKPKNAVLHWAVVVVVFLCIAGGLFKSALAIVANKAKPQNAHTQVSPSAAQYAATHPILPVATVAPVPSVTAAAIQKPVSSVTVPVVPSVANSVLSGNDPDKLPRVIGLVGDANGKHTKYLLSTGQITTCNRSLSIGDVYIR